MPVTLSIVGKTSFTVGEQIACLTTVTDAQGNPFPNGTVSYYPNIPNALPIHTTNVPGQATVMWAIPATFAISGGDPVPSKGTVQIYAKLAQTGEESGRATITINGGGGIPWAVIAVGAVAALLVGILVVRKR